MILDIIGKLFGTNNSRVLKKMQALVIRINYLEEEIKALRSRLCLYQKDFAPMIGITERYVIYLEKGVKIASHRYSQALLNRFGSKEMAAFLARYAIVYRIFQDYVLQPYLMSSGVALHPLLVIFGVLAGEQVGGVAGMFLSIPALATLRVVYVRLLKWQHARTAGIA